MQTFLPFPDLRVSCEVLDDRRLGKQRVETYQILRALTWPQYAWKNHPAVRMWRGFVPGLVAYGLESCHAWTRRGRPDTVAPQLLAWTGGAPPEDYALPPWFGLEALHLSHRSALLRKEPQWYRPLFASLGHGDDPDDLPYLWPSAVFPRWPVRGGLDGLPLQEALRLLGHDEPRPGQAEAVGAVAVGRDCLLVARPGTGGSTAGLLAGLVVPGRTLWVSPWEGRVAPPAPPVTPAPAVTPAPRRQARPSRTAPPIARPPAAQDLAAMQAEHAAPEFRFAHPDRLPTPEALQGTALLVVDRAHALTDDDAARLAALRAALGGPPVLAVTGQADAGARRELSARLGLRDPVHAGGGWDAAGTWLGGVQASTAPARTQAVTRLVRRRRPALVVVPTRERAERTASALAADGLRAAVWAPPPMRAARATAALGRWRSRSLDALVVPGGRPPELGRARPALLVVVDPPGLADAHALVDGVAPPSAVLVAGPQAGGDARALVTGPGCLRAGLLAGFGEPVEVPCGRCDRCAPSAGADAADP